MEEVEDDPKSTHAPSPAVLGGHNSSSISSLWMFFQKTKGMRGAGQGGPRHLFGDSPDGRQQLWGLRKSHISVLSLALPLCLQPSSDYRKVEERRLAAGKHFSRQATAGS